VKHKKKRTFISFVPGIFFFMNPLCEKAVLLVMLAVILSAGCSSQTPAQNPASSPLVTSQPTAAPAPDLYLSDLAISSTDLPFKSVREYGTCQYVSPPQAPLGYTMRFLDHDDESEAATIFTQEIIGIPAGEAAPSFANATSVYLSMNKPPVSITRLPDPGIGDESIAFSVEITGPDPKKGFLIVFRKNNVIETLSYHAPVPDYAGMKAAAAAAAARVRPGRYTMPAECPVRPALETVTSAVPSAPAAASGAVHAAVETATPGISLAGPVQIAISPSGSVGTISLSLAVTPGNPPVDMTRMSYVVSTPATLMSIKGNDPAARLTWTPASAGSDNQLGPGETVTVVLDVSSQGISPTGSGVQIDIDARPAIGAALPKRCILPATVSSGSTFSCA